MRWPLSPLLSSKRARLSCYRGLALLSGFLLLAGMTAPFHLRATGISVPPAIGANRQEQEKQDIATLEPGTPIKRVMSGGETHLYQITLVTGQFLRAIFDQRGINLLITLYGPDGKKIADLDSPIGMEGPEPVSLIAETSGSYRLEARPMQKSAPKGQYEARIEELRTATPRDKLRVDAERVFAEATIIAGQGTAESKRQAIEKYRESIPLWQGLGDPQQEAHTLTVIGYNYKSLSEPRQALDYYGRALPLNRAANDRQGEAMTLYQLGSVYNIIGDHQKALDFYHRAVTIFRAVGDRSMEAATLGNTGVVRADLGEYQPALDLFNQALALKRELNDHYGEATLLNNIGLINNYLSEKQKALDYYNQALPLYQALNDHSGEATTLNNISTIYDDLGEYQKALDFLNRVVEIKRASGNRIEEAIALGNIGVVYGKTGQQQKALEFYNQALPLTRAAGGRSMEAVTLSNIGRAYGNSGEHRKALDFFNQALSIQQALGERRGIANTLTHLGRAYRDLGDPPKALEFFSQSLLLRRTLGDRSGEALTLYNIAHAQRDLNNLAEAFAQIESALAIIETLRTKVSSQGLRTSYLASIQRYYELGIELLMQRHRQQPSEKFVAAALQLSERARARSLLELLVEARADIRQGVSPELLARERSLQQSLDTRAAAQMRLLNRKHSPEQAAAAAEEINALTSQYEEVQAQIRRHSPRYAALTQPVPLSLKEIQTEVLDPDTLLLEYALGQEKSYLWAVTPTSIESFELPTRAEIETAAQRVYEILTARNLHIPNETPEQKRRRVDLAEAKYPEASAALSRMLLGPAASQLSTKRLLIVGDGMLQYVPFASLPQPESGRQVESGGQGQSPRPRASFTPLIIEHEVVSLPSASVLAVLRRESAGRVPAAKTVAVLADPVFQKGDPRIGPSGTSRAVEINDTSTVAGVSRPAAESAPLDFTRLRFSRLEAEQITRLVPEGKKLKALDFAASRATATSAELGQYSIVHFATHGLINNQHPELSGIVLSQVDEQGRPQNGFLRLHDIYNLRLGADLVVLSACQTALGKEIKGEGLIGLTRGFMYAGAPRVAASLWRIDDRATAELMKRFYSAILEKGQRPAAALRAAQISMWQEQRWNAPHYWAAFTLQGEWR